MRSTVMDSEVAMVLILMEPRMGPYDDTVGRDSDAELEGRELLPLAFVGGVDDLGEAMPDGRTACRHSRRHCCVARHRRQLCTLHVAVTLTAVEDVTKAAMSEPEET